MRFRLNTLFVFVLGVIQLFSQSYDLQFRVEQDDAVGGGIYEITVQIAASGSAFELGISNLVFSYNPAAISPPPPIGPGTDSLQIQAIHNFSGGSYEKLKLTQPVAGTLSLNIELLTPNTGITIFPSPSFLDVASIRFMIVDPLEPKNLTWSTVVPNQLTVFADNEASLASSNQLDGPALLAGLKLFLEGPYSAGGMSTILNDTGLLPLTQPYSVPPWNYPGAETVAAIPAGMSDWVLLELRSGPQPGDSLTSRAAFIRNDGAIVDLNGVSPVTFAIPDNPYYVAIFHRNHLAVMNASQTPLNKASNELPYDFSSGSAQFYGTNGAIEIDTGVWGMISGDGDASGTVDALDRANTWNARNSTGYIEEDHNLNGTVDAFDRAITWNNRNRSSTVGITSSKVIKSQFKLPDQQESPIELNKLPGIDKQSKIATENVREKRQ